MNNARKIILVIIFILFASTNIFADKLEDICSDLYNMRLYGKRPLFYGIEYYINSLGAPIETGNNHDFYITGEGFFVLYNPKTNEILFTRNGSFRHDVYGNLINSESYYVLSCASKLPEEIVFINYWDIATGSKDFKDTFLIINPNAESVTFISSDYIVSKDYTISDKYRQDSYYSILRGFLEIMPIDFEHYVNAVLEYLKKNIYEKSPTNSKVIELFNKRLHELYTNILYTDIFRNEKKYNLILQKIERIEKILLNSGEVR